MPLRDLTAPRSFVWIGLVSILAPVRPGEAVAAGGAASGNVAVVDAGARAYGYSGYNETWTPVALDAGATARLASDYLGYVRTPLRLYSFNPTNDRWYWTSVSGLVLGESALGATTVCWTTHAAYAIASLWSIWRSRPWEAGESPLGGGSCGSFALVWTQSRAYAFHSASGQWMTQALAQPASGGITCPNFGLVWTPQAVYSFDPSPGGWVPVDLGLADGISVTGEGNVALAWSAREAVAYSGVLDAWFPVEGSSPILDGTARGNLALFWSAADAWVFDANSGLWSSVAIESGSGGPKPPDPIDVGSGFAVHPNPAPADRIRLALPGGPEWEVEVFDVSGRRVRSFRPGRASTLRWIEWDRADESGRRLAAGAYWVQARSADAVEVRRIALLP